MKNKTFEGWTPGSDRLGNINDIPDVCLRKILHGINQYRCCSF